MPGCGIPCPASHPGGIAGERFAKAAGGVSAALLGLAAGGAVGAVMATSGLCFSRALRRAVFERRPTLLRAFAIAVATQLVLLPVLVATGVDPLEISARAGGPALLP